jgi:hypothetical protein
MDHWHVSRLRETQFDLKARYDFTSGVDAAGCSKIETSHPPALGLPRQPLNPEAVFPQQAAVSAYFLPVVWVLSTGDCVRAAGHALRASVQL